MTAQSESAKKSLYERLGGAPSIDAAVDMFYKKVLADKSVNFFFDGVDMKKQHRMQKGFLTFAFGGPGAAYTGRGMRIAHQRLVDDLGLNDSHYDTIVGHLGATLKELGVGDVDVAEAAKIANSVRDDILCKPPKSLYERLGGAPAIDAAVDVFYKKVLADKSVNFFFDGVDMKKQHRMQKGFFTFAFGGPGAAYTGRGMRIAHQRLVDDLGLNDSHYDTIVGHLGTTLKELGVSDADVAEAAKIANSIRDDVLCKPQKPKSLYERLGGAPAIDAAVDVFYKKVLADKSVNFFFDGVDMKKQHRMQKGFFTFAFGGPGAAYTGRGMRIAHQRLVDDLGLNDSHYDTIVGHLGATLKELGVGDADVAEAAQIANSIRDDVLCKPQKPAASFLGYSLCQLGVAASAVVTCALAVHYASA